MAWTFLISTDSQLTPFTSNFHCNMAHPTPPNDALPWKDRLLDACSRSDIQAIESLLAERDEKLHPEDDGFIQSLLSKAVASNQAETLVFLLQRYPEFPKKQQTLIPVHDSIFTNGARLPVYKVLVERYPFLKDWDFGHLADHLGFAASNDDFEFVEYLLENGADAASARFFHFPVSLNN